MRVVVQPGYERTVAAALDALIGNGALPAAEHLLDRTLHFLPRLLAEFPRAGRDFVVRNPASPRVAEAAGQVRALLGTDIELREYILDDYLVLYAIRGRVVHLLALRHHRQSGFDAGP
ncbi:MAG: type II toxin-antitoxin system RelE/ParE family toxin [Xanthomonadales bacterium]|nr:type II toxin-antitoxin system RelE/ParE family toxin [Xanthomonadales bacterium]